jgi:hypothetical protein
LIVICPSCAASNVCPDAAAGLTICCRRCKTQISLPPDAPEGGRTRWFLSRYWLAMILAELVAVGGALVCIERFVHARPPADLPFLAPSDTGRPAQLATAGGLLPLRWRADCQSAGGFFGVIGQNITLVGFTETQLREVQVSDNRWPAALFESPQPPPAEPLVLDLLMRLPDDENLLGERVSLKIAVNVEYPSPPRPGTAMSIRQETLRRDWSFVVATRGDRARLAGYERGRGWLRTGAIACGVLAVVVALAAGLLAQRQIAVQCPKCGRVTNATYTLGGNRLQMSSCPHKGSRPVESRRR